jgi:hypothetical protein
MSREGGGVDETERMPMRNMKMRSIMTVLAAAGLAFCGAQAMAQAEKAADKPAAKSTESTMDVLIFRDGRVMNGTIVSETSTSIKFRGTVGNSKIPFETDYPKNDILEIKRGVKKPGADEPAKDAAESKDAADSNEPELASATPVTSGDPTKPKYYWIKLAGVFGEQITQTPLREQLRDARKNGADVIILELNAAPPEQMKAGGEDSIDVLGHFDTIFRAEDVVPIIVNEMPAEWTKMPRLAIWVRGGLGGAFLVPLVVPEMYFHPEGVLGGIGNLSTMMKGHERVVEKQISLRMGHVIGWFQKGGYGKILGPNGCELLIRAMARAEQVLSVRYENGRPVFSEEMPKDPSEELLTDDGKEINGDTLEQIARNEGNDSLNIRAALAQRLGLSRGTVASREELLAAMGIDRTHQEAKGRSEQIRTAWNRGLEDARKDMRRLGTELEDVRVDPPGGRNELDKADNQRIQKLEQAIRILSGRHKEAITPQWIARNARWMFAGWDGQEGVDGIVSALRTRVGLLKLEIQRRR